MITLQIDYEIDWSGADLKKIREDIDNLEKLGATHINIDSGESYGASYCHINAFMERLETDDEINERIEDERLRQDMIEKHELRQLEILKAKYEKG